MKRMIKVGLWLLALGLVLWSVRSVPLAQTAVALWQLSGWQIALLIVLNGLVLLALNGRWYLLLRGLGTAVAFVPLLGYRLAAFGVSYFTPGPQFGGEPLQVLLVSQRHDVPHATAVAAVTLDKTLELLVNFAFLLLAALLVLPTQLFGSSGGQAVWLGAGFLLLPLGLLLALWRGKRPLTAVMHRLSRLIPNSAPLIPRLMHSLSLSETQMITLCQQSPGWLLAALFVSLLGWGLMIVEFGLMVRFLGLTIGPLAIIAMLLAARIAFLLPLPGGIGSLEASQVLVLGLLGENTAVGLSLSLLIRARDMLLGLLGLALGNRQLRWRPHSFTLMSRETENPIRSSHSERNASTRRNTMSVNLSSKQWTIVALTVATALIHLFLALGNLDIFGITFLLNAAAYLALIAGLYFIPQLAPQRGLIRWALLGVAAITFLLYFVFNWPDVLQPLGIIDKLIELALIVLLWQEPA